MSAIDRRTRPAKMALVALQGGGAKSDSAGNGADVRPGRMSQLKALCKVCTAHLKANLPNSSILQNEADTLYSRGAPLTEVHARVRTLTAEWPASERPSYDSVRRHTLSHILDITESARKAALERLRQVGEAREAFSEQYVDHVVDSTMFLALRARDRVALGEIEPKTVTDVVRILHAYARFRPDPETQGISPWEHQQDLVFVIEAARRRMDKSQYAEFLEDLRSSGNPGLETDPQSGSTT
jgi:hypothetical protein